VLGQAGFGRIGREDHCAAETRVRGNRRPLEAARLIRSLHPYEEPLIMVIPLLNDALEADTQGFKQGMRLRFG
jgi:hypothetical protein